MAYYMIIGFLSYRSQHSRHGLEMSMAINIVQINAYRSKNSYNIRIIIVVILQVIVFHHLSQKIL